VYLVDTNIVSYLFKDAGRVAEHMRAVPPSQVAVSSISLYELHAGILKAGERRERMDQLRDFAAMVQCVDFGEREAVVAAGLRAELERLGKVIGPLDILLAGTAVAHGATFVTRNVREFSRIKGLKVENWY
jgi:tRNA(fMet)-specific endonuclease VapC